MTLFYVFKDTLNNRLDWRGCDQYGQPPLIDTPHEVGWVIDAATGREAMDTAVPLFDLSYEW